MAGQYWFNTATGQVEEGRVSDWRVVLGPYPTREAAEQALGTARRRSADWDEADRHWRGDGGEPGGGGERGAGVDERGAADERGEIDGRGADERGEVDGRSE